jgi:alpha-L-fucosidase 2
MIFGSLPVEHIQVNEHTIWEGRYTDRVCPTGLQALPEIRRLLFAREYGQAQRAIEDYMFFEGNKRIGSYQPLCSLLVSSSIRDLPSDDSENYRRILDLKAGVHRVEYEVRGRKFRRECFASLVDGVIASKFTYPEPGQILLRLDRERDVNRWSVEGDRLMLEGRLGKDGVRFRAEAVISHDGDRVETRGNALVLHNAREVTILLCGATSYLSPDDLSADPAGRCGSILSACSGKSYEKMREAHVAKHRALMQRVSLATESGEDHHAMPTQQRLAAFAGTEERRLSDESLRPIVGAPDDWDFYALVFQACRYSLIGSSLPGSQPSTLQGRWCGVMNPAWESDYHPNINLQMNYWLANPTNLDECNQPLFAWMKQIAHFGRDTAKRLYNCDGWVLHHVSDIFGTTAPMNGPCGVWPIGGTWMCLHLWEHYQFTQDREFLRNTALPIMLGAARFMLDFLVEAPAGTPFAGKLVTNPSHSPENTFLTENGDRVWFCVAAAMDTQIIEQLFRDYLSALEALGETSSIKDEVEAALQRLPPMQISPRSGRLMEWIEDFDEPEPGHRHISHLFAIYPGNGITATGHPDLVAAARKSIEWRLANHYHATGWSLPWLACVYARLGEGDKALEMLTHRLAHFTMPNVLFSNAHGQPQIGDACGFGGGRCRNVVAKPRGFSTHPACVAKEMAGRVHQRAASARRL